MVYITKSGDMWDSIAYSQLGDENYTDLLINANQKYRNYYIFPSGIPLVLPEISPRVSRNLPPWKRQTMQ